MNVGLVKSFKAGAAIAQRRIVKFGAADGEVIQAAAAADLSLGVCVQPGGASAAGERVDVQLTDIAEVEFGGAVTRGQEVTSDASGKAVAAAPGAGANVRIVGIAMNTQANGDFGDVLLSQGVKQG